MYDISDHVTAGVNFRSKSLMKVKAGKTEVKYATSDPAILGLLSSKLDGISKTEFSAEMPLPATLGFGASWHNSRVVVDLEASLHSGAPISRLILRLKARRNLTSILKRTITIHGS